MAKRNSLDADNATIKFLIVKHMSTTRKYRFKKDLSLVERLKFMLKLGNELR